VPKLANNIDIRLRRSAVPGNVPTVEQLQLGELAINTADGKLFLKKEYDGGIEQIIEVGAKSGAGLSSTYNNYIYTSDGGLQTVTGADDAGNVLKYDLSTPTRIQVHLNGVLLHQGIDFVANNGTSIIFAFPIDAGQVIQVSAYNSEGASFDNDFILDDGYSFTVGTDEETRFYHNGTNTILKHLGYNGGDLKIQYRDSDRIDIDSAGVNIFGSFRLNGDPVVTLTDVISAINTEVDTGFVEALNISASFVSYVPDSDHFSTNVQQAIDHLYDSKLDISALNASIVLYPTTATIAVDGTYTKMVTSINDSDYDAVAVDVNTGNISGTDQLIANLSTEQGVLVGNTGVINIHTVGNVRVNPDGSNGSATFYYEVYKRTGAGVETLLSTSSASALVSVKSYVEFFADALLPPTDFTATDRIVKYYGNKITGNSNTTYDFQFGGESPVRSNFPVPVSVVPQDVTSGIISTDTTNFDGILSVADDTVQKALDTIDGITTTDIPQGDNLYFTTEASRSVISAGNGLIYDPVTGQFDIDTTSSVQFGQVSASTFVGSLLGNAATASDADLLDGNHGSHYRIDIYDINGVIVN
jgi:hypothetical protein